MRYKFLFTFIFLCLSSLLRSQGNLHQDLDKQLFSYAHAILLRTEADNSFKKRDNAFVFPVGTDTAGINKRIRAGIINKARNYIGVSYRYGQSSEKGFDCSGFVKYVFRDFGFDLPHSSYIQYKISKHIEITEAQPGDLVFFVTRGTGASHVGIYLGNNQFIHSPGNGRTVSIDSLGKDYYKKHLFGFGSLL